MTALFFHTIHASLPALELCTLLSLSDYECNLSHRASVGAHDLYICMDSRFLIVLYYMHISCQSTLEISYLIWKCLALK